MRWRTEGRQGMENIDWRRLLFAFDGRINRGEFWLGSVALWLFSLLVGGLLASLSSTIG